MSIFGSINNNKTFILTTRISLVLIITVGSLFFVSEISNQTFAQEGNLYEGLGIKIKYFDPWEIGSKDDDPSCLDLCLTGLQTPDLGAMLLISQDKFNDPEIKNKCKCDTLLEFVKYRYEDSISKSKDLVFINDNKTTLTDGNIPAIQIEYENKGDTIIGETVVHIFIKGPNSFYGIIFSAHKNEQYSKHLDDFKKMINSLEFVTTNETITNKPKLPSFMTTNDTEEKDQIALPNQQEEIIDQQQLSVLTLYEDPKGKFTLEYDPSLWIAIPDKKRFDEIEVTFADKETGGKDVGATIAIVKDPRPDLPIKEQTEIALPGYLGNNEYEDRQLEEGVECVKTTIQGYDICSFILSYPKSYFDTYPRIYSMIASAKIGDELWLISFNAPGDKFEEFEQSVVQMINSMKVITTTTEQTTKDLVTSNTYKCNPIDESITLQNKIDPKGVVLLGDYGNCKLNDGIVTINLPNKNDDDLQFTVMNIDINSPTNSQGAIIEMEQIKEDDKNSSEDNKIFKINLNKEMNGKNPITGKPIKISEINGLALYNTGENSIPFNSQNNVKLNINFQ